jgi:orotate phosphoribosyltransferase
MESGYHSEQWFELDRLFDHPAQLQPLVEELARRLAAHRPEAICGPMTGGATLAAMIATQLGVEAFHSERIVTREPGLFPVKYFIPAGQRDKLHDRRVVIVDDVISAGSAVKGTHADLLACAAHPVACAALIIFGEKAAAFAAAHNLPLEAITRAAFGMWLPGECPQCAAGVRLEVVADAAPGGA